MKYFLCLAFAVISHFSFGQNSVEMADGFRQNGMIYVVVAVLLVLLFGVLFYLIRLDRKIGKLEKEIKD